MRTGLFVLSTALLSACAVVPSPAYPRTAVDAAPRQDVASDKYGPEPGESLLQFGGALTSQSQTPGGDSTSIALQGGIGWFQNEWLEIGGQVLGNLTLPDAGSDSVLVSVAPYLNGNYKLNERLWLYAGPHLGLAYLDFSNDSAVAIEYGLHGGTRYWLDPRTSVFGELRYTHAQFDISPINIDSDTFQVLFGFSVVF